ncbi:protein C1orf43 homolog isoform X2 [Ornithorhynchus anatinus]|uniref:protein C1orf43 homolog isoform X2 n=1 Tax=Ornithorhynchus anatinus TaxID=9258 RepID=UPI0010A947BC|nr:protein C1orf43 homolog isoform X2 [Ornithorhynchus anatinus]
MAAGGGGGGGSGGNWLSGVNVVLVMAYGSLDLKEEIDIRLSKVQDVKYEPRLLAEDDARLLQLEAQGNQCTVPDCFNYLYRMKALDAIRTSEIPFHHAESRHPRSLVGTSFRSYLLELRTSATPFKGVRKALVDTLLDGYETARYGTGAFGRSEYLSYREALRELAATVKARGSGSQRQHQTAAKDLTQSPEAPLPSSPSPSTIQVTYLPPAHRSKRAKHFLELKSFKDSYNTLESTL